MGFFAFHRFASYTQLLDTFVVVGGDNSELGAVDTIYKYNPITDEWDLLDQRLSLPREFSTNLAIPDSFATCS